MIKNIYILLFVCFSSFAIGQSCKVNMKAGDKAFEANNYSAALSNYGMALKADPTNAEYLYKHGEAAYNVNAFSKSARSFGYLIDTLQSNEYPDAIYKLAKSKESLGMYSDAEKYYNLYISEYGDVNPAYTKAAKMAKDCGMWASSQPNDQEELTVTRMGDEVNSIYSDHSPYLVGDDLYFSSLRYGNNSCDPGSVFSKVLKTNGKSSNEVKGNDMFNGNGQLTSNSSFTTDGSGVYYSICEYLNGDDIRCDLYYSDVNDKGVVGAGKKLSVNVDGATTTMPSITDDGRLFFSSDRAGGKGGMDIYVANVNDDMTVGAATNYADVNSSGDDRTPFYHNATGNLFFSTDSRCGFGGLDIFSQSSDGTIENLGAEINTPQNDLFYVLSDDGVNGYLASNRIGSLYIDDNQTCCYDIYHAVYDRCEIDLLANICDGSTGDKMNGATVTVVNNSTGEVVYEETKADSHEFKKRMDCADSYTVTACKDGYVCNSTTVGPVEGKSGLQKTVADLCLAEAKLEICACEMTTSADMPGASVTLYNVTDGNPVKAMVDGACHTFPIESDKDYKLSVTNTGYDSNISNFNSGNMRSLTLSQRVCLPKNLIATCSSYVPVRLYFDNDHPNPRSRTETSSLSYSSTYGPYYGKKAEFLRNYGKLFGYKGRDAAEGDINAFFEREVKGGYDNFNALLNCLKEVLEGGGSLNLFIRGYASPISPSEYNAALGKRRVDVVRNEIKRYQNGILAPYIANGQLKITERSFGEDTAPSEVSDSRSDRRKSVYSPEASRERRVEIDEIRFEN